MRPNIRARGRVLAVAAAAALLTSDRAAVASPDIPELLEELSTLTLRIGGSPDIGIAMRPVETFLIGSLPAITARLTDTEGGLIDVTLGPVVAADFLPDTGLMGLGTTRAHSRFSFFLLEEL